MRLPFRPSPRGPQHRWPCSSGRCSSPWTCTAGWYAPGPPCARPCSLSRRGLSCWRPLSWPPARSQSSSLSASLSSIASVTAFSSPGAGFSSSTLLSCSGCCSGCSVSLATTIGICTASPRQTCCCLSAFRIAKFVTMSG